MGRSLTILRRYWLIGYWLGFACLAALAAQDPGYALRSQPLPPFPWLGLVIIWAILAIETYGLHFFLYWHAEGKSSLWRVTKATFYSLALSIFFILTFATDQGVLFEIPMWFAFASLAVFGAFMFGLGAARLWRVVHAAP